MTNDTTVIRQLQRRADEDQDDLRLLEREQDAVTERLERKRAQLKATREQIERTKAQAFASGRVTITEHALLRYCERVLRIDMGKVAADLLPDDVRTRVLHLGSGVFPVGGTHTVRAKAGVIVTVLTKDTNGD